MSDKRSVKTDALETLGTIIDDTAKRDAIHLAVEPVVAGENLFPGQEIGIVNGRATTKAPKKLGIVDPFVTDRIYPGDMLWLVVFPRQITSLRHVWTHPAFDQTEPVEVPDPKSESEKWLRDFIGKSDCPAYETIMERVLDDSYVNGWTDEYFHFEGQTAGGDIPDKFWDHMEIVTDKKISRRPSGFSCSC